jgi:hypothetical protein
MHRLIRGSRAGKQVDHRNLNTLDNRRGNLRDATHGQNQQNKSTKTESGIKGVCRRRNGRWGARIRSNRYLHYLGTFDTPTEAGKAYDRAAKRLFGEFARLNFP